MDLQQLWIGNTMMSIITLLIVEVLIMSLMVDHKLLLLIPKLKPNKNELNNDDLFQYLFFTKIFFK